MVRCQRRPIAEVAAGRSSIIVGVSGPKRTVGALVLSLVVYLTPLVGPHALWFLGELVWREIGLGRGGRSREPLWIATDIATALSAQLVFFLLLYWFLGHRTRASEERASVHY